MNRWGVEEDAGAGQDPAHRAERGDASQIVQAERTVDVVTVQNRYSLADRRHEETLRYCERQRIGFLPWYPLAAGKLLQPDHPSAPSMAQLAARHEATVAAFHCLAAAEVAHDDAHSRDVDCGAS